MKKTLTKAYAGFDYTASQLSAYTSSIGIFSISLKNGHIVHFKPEDREAFEQWLQDHKIRDIRRDDGITKYMK